MADEEEVDVWLDLSNFINGMVGCAYAFAKLHFSELSSGVVPEVEAKQLKCLV